MLALKKPISFFLTFLLFISLALSACLNAYAYIESDGKVNLYEWENCDKTVLFKGYDTSGTCYHSICVKYRYIHADRRIYVAVIAENGNSELSKAPESNVTNLYLSFNGSSRINVCSDGSAQYGEDEFFLKYGSSNDSFGGVSYEAEVVLKETDFDGSLTMYLQMKDYEGNLSQIFEVNVKSEELKEAESLSEAEREKSSVTEESVKKNPTRKPVTEKETTSKPETVIKTEEYVPYSDELKKNNKISVAVGTACVTLALAATCVLIFKKK